MPDLLTHLLIGLILAELFNVKKKSLIILGAIAPDILSKISLLYFYLVIEAPISFNLFHTPFMILLISILIAPLFRYDKFKTIILINIGAISHFLFDLTMKHFTVVGTRLFYPITNANYTFNLIWPEKSFYILIGSLLIYIFIRIIKGNIPNRFKFWVK